MARGRREEQSTTGNLITRYYNSNPDHGSEKSTTGSKRKASVLLDELNDADTIIVRPRKSARSNICLDDSDRAKTIVAVPTSSKSERMPLHTVNADEFQNKLHGAITNFRLPTYDGVFLSKFQSSSQTRPNCRYEAACHATDLSAVGPPLSRGDEVDGGTVQCDGPQVPGSSPTCKRPLRRRSQRASLLALAPNKSTARQFHSLDDDVDELQTDLESIGSVFDDQVSIPDSVPTSNDYQSDLSSADVHDPTDEDEEAPRAKGRKPQTRTKSVNARTMRSKVEPVNEPANSSTALPRRKATQKKMKSLLTYKSEGLKIGLAPLSDIGEIFEDLTERARSFSLDEALHHLRTGQPLIVATMCSGTEAPFLAFQEIQEAAASKGLGEIRIQHAFSAEIVPFKQAYIERNFRPPIIFRDITELTGVSKHDEPTATTAYGSQAKVPIRVHILIAGTSCVDFSNLNNSKKGIHAGGESGDTWHAVLDYCRAFRPTIVILENVKNADWDQMLDDYSNIGYDCAGVHVDSKDFYIPHTRQRGYMVCFDKEKLASAKIDGAAEQWTSLMEKFKRPASTSVSSFLLPSDKFARRQLWDDDSRREVDWSQCEITQMDYRQNRRLGILRPVTNWSESGSMLVPDHAYRPWFPQQVERVLDTIDGAMLRKALPKDTTKDSMYDTLYKTRVWDLSQNIYRFEDTQPFGITTCLTPSGIPYLSDAARPLAPEETLTLQGIPLDKISFTTETPSNMQDLAGNAMTSTVIGSAILSALIAGYKCIEPHPSTDEEILPSSVTPAVALVSGPDDHSNSTTDNAPNINVADLLHKARQTLRRCYCEGSRGITMKQIQTCADCGHTTCIECGGNPVHRYGRDYLQPETRSLPADFEDELKAVLPLRIAFDPTTRLPDMSADFKADADYSLVVAAMLKESFAFERVRRTHCWTVTYRASGAHLDLVIEQYRAEWRLFVDCDKKLPSNHPQRAMLQTPVAKSQVTESLCEGTWLWRVPDSSTTALGAVGSPSRIASWWSRIGLPDYTSHTLPEYLDIDLSSDAEEKLTRPLSGRYQYLPRCGKACSSLYKKLDDADHAPPLFFFLDPTRTGHVNEDCFVFSENIALLEYDETRPVVARVAPPWRPWACKGKLDSVRLEKADLICDDIWHKWETRVRLVPTTAGIEISTTQNPSSIADELRCSEALTLIRSQVPSTLIASTKAGATLSDERFRSAFLKRNTWIFEAMKRYLPPNDWLVLNEDNTLDCHTCAPERPALRWSLIGDSVRPCTDHQSAALYERCVKSRPHPIVTEITQGPELTSIALGINARSLAHRARARLPPGLTNVRQRWRFDTASAASKSSSFPQFKLMSTRGIEPHQGELGMSVTLFPQQQLALAWMKRQEADDGALFDLEEAEEAVLDPLGWRAEVRVQGTIAVRGGICADHPGFGKTITSLALIKSHLDEMKRFDIELNLASRQDGRTKGLIATAATLIVCPTSLIAQWQSEIRDKLRWLTDCIMIKNTTDLKKHSIEDFRKAKIIIVSRKVLVSDTYIDRLAAFAAIPGPTTMSGRAFGQWLRHAAEQVPGHLEILTTRKEPALRKHVLSTYAANLDSEMFKTVVPSKRLRGREYVAGKSKKTSAQKSKGAPSELDTTGLFKPLFQMFYFNRIIIDEFHQHDSKEHAAIVALNADKRWGLSGTPAIGDFYEVAQMASLLGVSLRIGSDARGVMKVKNVKELRNNMSSAELFDAMRQKPSEPMHARIHELDQLFLDTFVRQNIMDFAEMKYLDQLMPVRLDLGHRVTYTELSQHLNSLDMRIKKKNVRKGYEDRQQRLHEAIESSSTAEEALSKSATFAHEQELHSILQTREVQIKEILAAFPECIRGASKTEATAFCSWKTALRSNVGDEDTVQCIDALVKQNAGKLGNESEHLVGEHESSSDEANAKNTAKGEAISKREKTASLNQLQKRLLVAKRSLRYIENVQSLQLEAEAQGVHNVTLCDSMGCRARDVAIGIDVAVSALCGHKLCRTCHELMKEKATLQCPAQGCSNMMHDHHLLWTNKMGDLGHPAVSSHGAKFEVVTKLLKDIVSRGDQAILFVQFEEQLDQIEFALNSRSIAAEVVKRPSEASSQIARFCDTAKTRIPVMVLNASDETAAGLNLQNANHVIFLSPLLRDTQYSYEATMAQAIGRVRRHGQKKQIHVYRLAALDTIDVDILEHRERRVDAITELGAPATKVPVAAGKLDEHGDVIKERTQLVRDGDGHFSLQPQSWLVPRGEGGEEGLKQLEKVKGKNRVLGWEDFSSLVKFSKTFTEDDN